MGLSEILALTKQGLIKHGPKIAKGIGVGGMFAAGYFLHKGIEESKELVKEKKEELEKDELDLKETVKTTWKCYIYPVVLGGGSLVLILWGENEEAKRTAALATAYSLSESALKEYRQKVIETVGEKKEKQIRDAVAADKLKNDPVTNKEVYVTRNGETLCYDSITGRYFKGDIEKIRKAENTTNKQIISEGYASLNDFFFLIGLPPSDQGDMLGWNSFDDGLLEITYTSKLAEDGTPCLVIQYSIAPKYDFNKFS